MTCVYPSDGVVRRLLEWAHLSTPIPLLRTQLYYLVCIFFRLALYNLVFVLRKEKYTPVLVGVCALLAIVFLSFSAFQPHPRQWWSKKFQFVLSLLIFVSCIATYRGHLSTMVVPVLLYMSIIGGLIQRWTCCCSP